MPVRRQDTVQFTSDIFNILRGYVSASYAQKLFAFMLCFSEGKRLDDCFTYVPDPSDKNCYFLSEIWNALRPLWKTFIDDAGKDVVGNLLSKIRESKLTPGNKLQLINTICNTQNTRDEVFDTQPVALTQLALHLLNYQGGTVYNPFAGTASYGLSLKIGDQYHAEEILNESWALGAIKLLLAKSSSHHFILGDSFKHLDTCANTDGHSNVAFNYVIATPPFGLRNSENRNRLAEELLLDKADNLLAPRGTMVMFALSSTVTKGGYVQDIRERLTEHNYIDTVIALPRDAFFPATAVPTVILILKRDRDNRPVKFLDARQCIKNRVLQVSEIIKRLEDPNSVIEVSLEQIRNNNYSWHPAKYEESYIGAPEKGYERIHLRDILIQTGEPASPHGQIRQITVSDLGSDPFSYRRMSDSIELKANANAHTLEITERIKEESEMTILNLKSQRDNVLKSLEQLNTELEEQYRMFQLEREAIEKKAHEEKAFHHKELADLSSQLNMIEAALAREQRHEKDGLQGSYIIALKQQRELLQKRIEHINENTMLAAEAVNHEISVAQQLMEVKIATTKDSIFHEMQRQRDLEEQITANQKRLADAIKSFETLETRGLIKVAYPALLLGGKKPGLRFAYISDASNSNPIYLINRSVSAFKVDTSRIDLDYLVYMLSTIEFKDYGEMVPMITNTEILEATIDILGSIEQQKAFISEKKAESNPILREMAEMRRQLLSQIEKERKEHKESEEKLLAALGSKQHDLGNLCPKITLMLADVYDSTAELPDDTLGKGAIMKQIEIIAAEMTDMNKIIKIISERDDFPAATRIDVIDFFSAYIEKHQGADYIIEPLHYDKTEVDAMGDSIFIEASDIALTRAFLNIRENAEMHGFGPDTRGIKHFISVTIRPDYSAGICNIDFSNNGLAMPEGMNETRYGTKGEKAGETAHTGNGGWYIAEMAKAYHGSFCINPTDADPNLVTIRLTLPLSHE